MPPVVDVIGIDPIDPVIVVIVAVADISVFDVVLVVAKLSKTLTVNPLGDRFCIDIGIHFCMRQEAVLSTSRPKRRQPLKQR